MPKSTVDLEVSDQWVQGVTSTQTAFIAENAGGNSFLFRYSAAQPTSEYGHEVAPDGSRDERSWSDSTNDENVWFKGLGNQLTHIVISTL